MPPLSYFREKIGLEVDAARNISSTFYGLESMIKIITFNNISAVNRYL